MRDTSEEVGAHSTSEKPCNLMTCSRRFSESVRLQLLSQHDSCSRGSVTPPSDQTRSLMLTFTDVQISFEDLSRSRCSFHREQPNKSPYNQLWPRPYVSPKIRVSATSKSFLSVWGGGISFSVCFGVTVYLPRLFGNFGWLSSYPATLGDCSDKMSCRQWNNLIGYIVRRLHQTSEIVLSVLA